jgi:hypothetical protein
MHDVNKLLTNFLEVWQTSLAQTPISKVIAEFSIEPVNNEAYGRGLEPETKVAHLTSRIMQSLVVLRFGYPSLVWNHLLTIPTPILFDVCFIVSTMSSFIVRDNHDSELVRYSWYYNFAMQLAILMHPKDEIARLGYIEELLDLSELSTEGHLRPIFMNESAIKRGISGPTIH